MSVIAVVKDAQAETLAGFDGIIDARSPGEFAVDHIPGALNLPVLTDAERAEVGTIYVQESRFKARRIGGAYVARNVALHLETVMSDWPTGFRPLVYCWRGGMRSNAMAVILAHVGWRVGVLEGGYRTYRRQVSHRLYDGALGLHLILLDGCTGSGKTEVLRRLGDRGVQTIDLEALAEHRGSLFGGLPGREQPSQRMFESRLLACLDGLDASRPVVVEAESSKVGQLMVPPMLWQAMASAPRIELTAPVEVRAHYLAQAYATLGDDPARLVDVLARLPDRPGRQRLAAWSALAHAGALAELATDLMQAHYDPAYRRWSKKHARPLAGSVELATLDAEGFERGADQVTALLASAPLHL